MQKFYTILSALILPVCFVSSGDHSYLKLQHETVIKPEKRVYHTLIYHDELKKTVLLDGYHRPDGTPEYGDIWTWDGAEWQIIPDKGPLVRFAASAAFDTKRKKLVLFGGLNANGPGDGTILNDTW